MLNKLQGISLFVMAFFVACNGQQGTSYTILNETGKTVKTRINPPEGFERIKTNEGSFGEFLQTHSLLPHGSPVKFYTGELKYKQNIHVAVLNVDVGNRDLQQCADAVIRLHAEYLYNQKKYKDIAYNFVSDGKPRYFLNHSNNSIDYKSFRKYMDYIFSYANTRSLYHQLIPVNDFENMRIGDVLIQTGNPYGHAVIVTDMAVDKASGKKVYLLSQSYMPAQSIHILINPKSSNGSPWYSMSEEGEIRTPEWNFKKEDLRRFK